MGPFILGNQYRRNTIELDDIAAHLQVHKTFTISFSNSVKLMTGSHKHHGHQLGSRIVEL
jgi:hypothetical protein